MSSDSNVRQLPPRGHYLAHEVGLLAGVSGNAIGQWARRGYIRSSQSTDIPRVYSYQDVAEAIVVHELLERGVPHAFIKRAIATLRSEYGDWPLTRARLATDEGRVYAQRTEGSYDVGDRGWQQVVNRDNLRAIAEQLNRGGWAVRKEPGLRHIEVDPDRLSGRPVIRGTRVPAETVARIAVRPDGRETLRRGYQLEPDEIEDAVRWWGVTQQFEAAA
jgi:uncharacterized protein (DUF433 family)/DNA-binding transcriptional MerR regulator